MTDASRSTTALGALRRDTRLRSGAEALRTLSITAGLCCAALFVVVGLGYSLQLYGDGAMFSYAVAVRDAWAFHWHNISGRTAVFLLCHVPAEFAVWLTGSPRIGITLYGLLFFSAPLVGLGATWLADRSEGRVIFGFACFSTAALCPLVFGFPTEMWVAHALFWPTLAAAHYARSGRSGVAAVFGMLLLLAMCHTGAIIFAASILATLALRGLRDPAFLRAAGALCVVLAIRAATKTEWPPDSYMAPVLVRAALRVLDPSILTGSLMKLVGAALAGYLGLFAILMRAGVARAHGVAAACTAAALVVYWVAADTAIHADNRYYLRTVLMLATPGLGVLAMVRVLGQEGRIAYAVPQLPRLEAILASGRAARAATGALAVLLLIHAVETAKFVSAWTHYKSAVQTFAMSEASDATLGDPRFVSATRISPALNRLGWFSTTPYFSILVSPNFSPARLVIDPASNFFWLSCDTATQNLKAPRAFPVESRRLVKKYSCLHR